MGVPVHPEQRTAAEADVKRRLESRPLAISTAPTELVNVQELATIEAALRMWQRHGMAEAVAANYQFVHAHPNKPRGNPPETLVATDDSVFCRCLRRPSMIFATA